MTTTTTTSPRYLTDTQIASYHREGYLALPRFLDAERVDALRRVTDAFVERSRSVTRTDAIFDLDPRHTAAAPVIEKPRRHTKPQLSRNGAEEYRRVLAGAGRADGLEVADVIHAVTSAAGVDGEAVRDVRVLERFTLFSVPDSEADRIIAAVDGSELAGRALRVELAKS